MASYFIGGINPTFSDKPICHQIASVDVSLKHCIQVPRETSQISPAGAGCPSNKVGSDLELHEEEFIGLRDYTEKKKRFWCTLLLPKLTKTLARKVKWPNTWLRSAAFFISQPLMLILGKHVCSNTMINFWNLMLRRAYKQVKVHKSKQDFFNRLTKRFTILCYVFPWSFKQNRKKCIGLDRTW